jgi:hypothetical protein
MPSQLDWDAIADGTSRALGVTAMAAAQ